MRYFYKYIKVEHKVSSGFDYGFVACYDDDMNRFEVCDKFGYPIQANTKEEALRLARLAIDDLNGKR